MIRIAIIGAGGRMGCNLIKVILNNDQCSLAAAICRPGSSIKDTDAGTLIGETAANVLISENIESCMGNIDVIIDFTMPEVTMELLTLCKQQGTAIVIGTTGFNEAQLQIIRETAQSFPIVLAPNMSPGVNLMFKLLQTAATALGHDSDIEIIEKHHRNKLDSPSGTALEMGAVIANTLNYSLKENAVYGRYGTETTVRDKDTIGFSSIRAGGIIGEHTALFASDSEILEITHKSSSRINYAKGAVQAALWLHQQPAGLYDMMDVLGIRTASHK